MNIEESKEKRFFSQDLDLVLVIHKKKRERKFPLFPIRRLFSFVVHQLLSESNSATRPYWLVDLSNMPLGQSLKQPYEHSYQ